MSSMAAPATLATATAAATEERFRALVVTERDRLVGLAYHLTGGNRELALDVAQEALLKAYRALPRFRGEAELSTWLTRIVIHEAASHVRSRARRDRWSVLWPWSSEVPPEHEPRAAECDDPARQLEQARLRARISAALLRLSDGQRAAFALVHLEGHTVEEAALVVGRSPGTLKSHLHRALVALRRELGDLRVEVNHVA